MRFVVVAESDGTGLPATAQDDVFDGFGGGGVMPLGEVAVAVGFWRRGFLLHVQKTPGEFED
jgi:hypothetical protein